MSLPPKITPNKRYREKRIREGSCLGDINCKNEVVHGRGRCTYHLKMSFEYQRNWRKKKRWKQKNDSE